MSDQLAFAAQFYVEHVMDSEILTQPYNEDTSQEWFDSVSEHIYDSERADQIAAGYAPQMTPFTLSFIDEMGIDFQDDGKDPGSVEEGRVRMEGLAHEDEANRLTDVTVELVDAELAEDHSLTLAYDSSQTLLMRGVDSEGAEVFARMTLGMEGYRVVVVFSENGFKVWDLIPGYYTWDNDIVE